MKAILRADYCLERIDRSRAVIGVIATAALAAVIGSGCGGDGANESGANGNMAAGTEAASAAPPSREAVFWNGATVYFLLTDRFANGDPSNDLALGRAHDGAVLRSYEGGDLAGVLQMLRAGWFDELGVDAIWMTPFVEQVHGSVDEGTGKTYGFHGYWTLDWTAMDPALGTMADLRAVVDEAHRRGIRVLMDAVINHTGPVTPIDPVWPEDWVRTGPRCGFRTYETTVDCALVANLPDILTGSDEPVDLPPMLVSKWEREGRLADETAELDAFFDARGYPRAPRYYVIKWLTDWVRELGFDGYRVDTAKHFEESVSVELKREAERALADWRQAHPDRTMDDLPFYMMGEVYNYDVGAGRDFDFGDRTVDFFDHGYDGLINFGFKSWSGPVDELYTRFSNALHGPLNGVAILNYASSHDDGAPWDRERERPLETGTRLLLSPGGAQIYYGDELARPLTIDGAEGDANLRSFMNWPDTAGAGVAARTLEHWRKVGQFRSAHAAVGAGVHRRLQAEPYIFSRTLEADGVSDRVLVATDLTPGQVTVPVFGMFADGVELVDACSGRAAVVTDGAVTLTTDSGLVLLAERE